MLLRQTKAEDVNRIWHSFFALYPTLTTLATAKRDGIETFLYTLGFKNQKAEALQMASNYILKH
ncbi:MAG: hypothetical protein D6722_07185, partial [Bacteroidetes bacterium]